MMRALAAVLTVVGLSGDLRAQPSRATSTRRAIADAMRLGDAAQLTAARAMIDSLVGASPQDSPELAEALFARATLAPSVLDATLDYEKIVNGLSPSPLREKSLLRLAQRALISGDDAKAAAYLRAMARDYSSDSSQARTGFWIATVLVEGHDIAAACNANRNALAHARAASFMTAELDAQAKLVCPDLTKIPIADSRLKRVTRAGVLSTTASPKKLSGKLYAVQVAAYGTRSDAAALSQRLRRAGLDAHVDGEVRPFRVRVGHFQTRAAAANALRELKTRQMAGFVTELDR